jgi:spore coat protein U-like protein
MKKLISSMVVMVVCAVLSVGAYAATQTGTLNVSVTAVPACAMAVTGITFPDYFGLPVTAAGTVTVNCPMTIPYNITLDAGQSTNFIPATIRRVLNDSGLADSFIEYDLFKDGALSIQWGDTGFGDTFTAPPHAGTGVGSEDTILVYGRMSGGFAAVPGTYSDIVTVTLHW